MEGRLLRCSPPPTEWSCVFLLKSLGGTLSWGLGWDLNTSIKQNIAKAMSVTSLTSFLNDSDFHLTGLPWRLRWWRIHLANAGDPGLIPGSRRSLAEENGYPLQDSCLENPMDRRAWRATVHRVTRSRTRNWATNTFTFCLTSRLSFWLWWRKAPCWRHSTPCQPVLGGGGAWWLSGQVVSDSCCPMDYSPPGSFVHKILLARILDWVAISSSRGSSQLGDQTQVSCIAGRFFKDWAIREAHGGLQLMLSDEELCPTAPGMHGGAWRQILPQSNLEFRAQVQTAPCERCWVSGHREAVAGLLTHRNYEMISGCCFGTPLGV